MEQTFQFDASCTGDHLIAQIAAYAIEGVVEGLAGEVPPGTVIADLCCGNVLMLRELADQLPRSRLGSSWQSKLSLYAFDSDVSSIELARTELDGKGICECVDLTQAVPLQDATVAFALLSQIDSVLAPDRIEMIIGNLKPKMMRDGLVGIIAVHPDFSARIARQFGGILGESESREVVLSDRKHWLHGAEVIARIFSHHRFETAAVTDFVSATPKLRYTVLRSL